MNQYLTLEQFRNTLLIINNSPSIKNVIVLVDPALSHNNHDYERDFKELIKRNVNYKIASYKIIRNEYNSLSRDLKEVESSNQENHFLEWLQELPPNNYENQIYHQPPLCSVIQVGKSYYGGRILVKVERGLITVSDKIEFRSEDPFALTMKIDSWHSDLPNIAHAGQLVSFTIPEMPYYGTTDQEASIMRGSFLGSFFDISKGSSVKVDSFWAEFKVYSKRIQFFKEKEYKVYCGQRELFCRVNRIIPKEFDNRDTLLIEFKPFIIYQKPIRQYYHNEVNIKWKQPTVVTTFEKNQNRGLCLIKEKNRITAIGKIRKVRYSSNTNTMWIDNAFPLFNYSEIIRNRHFADISII